MPKHLFAKLVDGIMYRDAEVFTIENDEEFERFLNGHNLPRHYYAYHYYGEEHWQHVLALPSAGNFDACIRQEIAQLLAQEREEGETWHDNSTSHHH